MEHAKLTIELADGSILTRVYDEEALINGHIDMNKEVPDMVDTLTSNDVSFF